MRRATPDLAALEVAYRSLRPKVSLEAALADPAIRIILENRARNHMRRRARIDVKKLQANDND